VAKGQHIVQAGATGAWYILSGMAEQKSISRLLAAWGQGQPSALDKLIPRVYAELRRLARYHLANERPGHTLQATALVNEAYLRLVSAKNNEFQDRVHFFAVAARLMRQILIDHARGNRRLKRGGVRERVDLDTVAIVTTEPCDDLIALDEALTELSATDERKARVVELRFFGGLDVPETAVSLGVSENTVIRDWAMAKAWLTRRLRRGTGDAPRSMATD
jgi:RNA polymerase sigma factor (TIGR02999 family)